MLLLQIRHKAAARNLRASPLAKRIPKSEAGTAVVRPKSRPTASVRQYVSVDDDPTIQRDSPILEDTPDVETSAPSPARPNMAEVFGPGGFLEKCMIGGYEHRAGQLEMAEMVHDAFENHRHAIVEAG